MSAKALNVLDILYAIFEKLAGQFTGAEFYKVDIDEANDIATEIGVRAVRPRLLVY